MEGPEVEVVSGQLGCIRWTYLLLTCRLGALGKWNQPKVRVNFVLCFPNALSKASAFYTCGASKSSVEHKK